MTLTGPESGTINLGKGFWGEVNCGSGSHNDTPTGNWKCKDGSKIGATKKCCPSNCTLSGVECYTLTKKDVYSSWVGLSYDDCTDSGYHWNSGCYKKKSTVDEKNYCTPTDPILEYSVSVTATGSSRCNSYTISCRGSEGGSGSVSVQEYPGWVSHPTTGKKRCFKTAQTQLNPSGGGTVGRRNLSPQYNGESIAYGGRTTEFGNPDGVVCYDKFYTRGCSSTPWVGNPVPPSTVPMGCWRKKDPTSTSDYNKYIYHWSYGPTNALYSNNPEYEWIEEGVGGMTEDKCRATEPTVCSPTSDVLNKKSEKNEAKYCSAEKLNVNYESSYGCTTDSNRFYGITCGDTLTAEFKPDNFEKVTVGEVVDGRVAVLQPGQGFHFGIVMNHVRSCNGTFDGAKFNDSYDKSTHYINRAEISVIAKVSEALNEYAWYTSLRDGVCPMNTSDCTIDNRTGGIVGIAKEYKDKYENLVNYRKFVFDYNGF